ncbi:MAG: phosphonate C-P lyase system protein PhnH [Hyphomicrobiales bacterium]|nr:phosphonate C-P lyase system protein PhnH [Hyphomicrobiales bacterium]
MSAIALADPVLESQAAFRAILRAMASPGSIVACGGEVQPPAPLHPATAAAILTLADFETPLWIAPSLSANAEVVAYLKFHTGAPIATAPGEAAFALLDLEADALDLESFSQGAPEYPDRSTTVAAQARSLGRGEAFRILGPGVRGEAEFSFEPRPPDFIAQWRTNESAFPLGVDLILAAGSEIAALPRTARIIGGG